MAGGSGVEAVAPAVAPAVSSSRDGRRMGLKLAGAVGALALFGGGVLLGVNLQDSGPSTGTVASPVVAAGGGGGPSTPAPTVAGASPAPTVGGEAPAPVGVRCTTLSGLVSGTPALGGCDAPAVSGGSGTLTQGSLGTAGSITVTWKGTGTTTFVFWATRPAPHLDRCPAGGTEMILHGAVTAGSPVGAGNGGVKGNIGARVCVDAAGQLSLLPGHSFKL